VRDEQPVEARLINHYLCNVDDTLSAHGVPTGHLGNLGLTVRTTQRTQVGLALRALS
jgi:hypothetical protein